MLLRWKLASHPTAFKLAEPVVNVTTPLALAMDVLPAAHAIVVPQPASVPSKR
jgi:hypothetical protein